MLLNHKPTIKFDPANRMHRDVIRGFLKTGRMDADYKFLHDSKYISVADQCKTELVAYFLDKEASRTKVAA
jgi:hypothetical protein